MPGNDTSYDDFLESLPNEVCVRCGRSYDDIDFDYQSCSKCGWDNEKKKYNSKLKCSPTDIDFLNGDADILTGQWNYD